MGQYLPHTFKTHPAVRVEDHHVQRVAMFVVFAALMVGAALIAILDGGAL